MRRIACSIATKPFGTYNNKGEEDETVSRGGHDSFCVNRERFNFQVH